MQRKYVHYKTDCKNFNKTLCMTNKKYYSQVDYASIEKIKTLIKVSLLDFISYVCVNNLRYSKVFHSNLVNKSS